MSDKIKDVFKKWKKWIIAFSLENRKRIIKFELSKTPKYEVPKYDPTKEINQNNKTINEPKEVKNGN